MNMQYKKNERLQSRSENTENKVTRYAFVTFIDGVCYRHVICITVVGIHENRFDIFCYYTRHK